MSRASSSPHRSSCRVTVANSAEFAPQTALLSLQDCRWLAERSRMSRLCKRRRRNDGLPRASAQYAVVTPPETTTPSPPIPPSMSREPSSFQSVSKCRRNARMQNISRKFVNGVGFSNGCALFAIEEPATVVPSSLIISASGCLARSPVAHRLHSGCRPAVYRLAIRTKCGVRYGSTTAPCHKALGSAPRPATPIATPHQA